MITFKKYLIESKVVPIDIEGNEIIDMDGKPIKMNSDGTIDIYHATDDEENYKSIITSKKWKSKIAGMRGYDVFFSNFDRGGEGFGDYVVHVRINPRYVSLQSSFHGGEVYVSVEARLLEKHGKIMNKSF